MREKIPQNNLEQNLNGLLYLQANYQAVCFKNFYLCNIKI